MTETNATSEPASTPAPEATQTTEPASNTPDPATTQQQPANTDPAQSSDSKQDGQVQAPSAGDSPPQPDTQKSPAEDSLLFKDEEKEEGEGEDDGEGKEGDESDKEGEEGDQPPAFDIDKLEVPEDMPIPDDVKEEVNALVKELENPDLSLQEKMQKMTDMHVKMMSRQTDAWEKMKDDWRQECIKDPDIGGDNLKPVTGKVNDLVRQFASNPQFGGSEELFNDLKADLTILGLGNKKSFIKFMHNIAKATGGDEAGGGKSVSNTEKLPREKILYPNMK